jgi:hypothetical protein
VGHLTAMPDPERPYEPARSGDEPDLDSVDATERAADEVDNPDPQTHREAVELELADQGLSDAGSRVGDEME